MVVGVRGHRKLGALGERRDLSETLAPMGVGSVIGTVAGGLLVGLVPAVSAVRIFRK